MWDGLRMIEETSPTRQQSLYLYTDTNSYEPLARIDRNSNQEQHIYYFHTDVNGMPEELTDETEEIVWECSYQLWGKPIQEIAHREIQQNLRYQGQYLDRETGLHYNTFRYYDPDTGRFTQPDPIGLNGGFNLYQYAPNPFTWIDPLGLTKDPVYENPGHHDSHHLENRRAPFNSSKSVIPKNAEELFKYSQVDPDDLKTRWTKVGEGKKAVWHRFQSTAPDGSAPFHWNGSTNSADIRGKPRAIPIDQVPKLAKKMKGCKL